MKRKVIRLEDSLSVGLFNSKCVYKSIHWSSVKDRHSYFPNPFNDKGIEDKMTSNHLCSYKSVEQLQQWIETEELKDLIDLGIRVYVVSVFDAIEGECQVIYKPENVIKKENITELFI